MQTVEFSSGSQDPRVLNAEASGMLPYSSTASSGAVPVNMNLPIVGARGPNSVRFPERIPVQEKTQQITNLEAPPQQCKDNPVQNPDTQNKKCNPNGEGKVMCWTTTTCDWSAIMGNKKASRRHTCGHVVRASDLSAFDHGKNDRKTCLTALP